MKFKDLDKYLTENYVFGIGVRDGKDVLRYKYLMMFRENKRPPEELKVYVDAKTKEVIDVRSDRRTFKDINDVIEKTRKRL